MIEVLACFVAMFFVANIVKDMGKHMAIAFAVSIVVSVSIGDTLADGDFFTTIGGVLAVSLWSYITWAAIGEIVFLKIEEIKDRFVVSKNDD